MRLRIPAVGACLVLVTTAACDLSTDGKSDQGSGCVTPSLTVVGRGQVHDRLPVQPGQTLRLHGTHYTDDCLTGGHETGTPIPSLKLILRSRFRLGPVATVHPHGPDAAFTVRVTIPRTTQPGPASITPVLGPPHDEVRLVVRR
jgi:hypothetical protein